MSFTDKIRLVYYVGSQSVADQVLEYVAGARVQIDETVPQSATTELIAAIDVSELQSIVLLSDKAAIIETNDSGTPDATITLEAGVPKIWSADVGGSNPLGAVDVTSFFVTLGAVGTARIQIYAAIDPTP